MRNIEKYGEGEEEGDDIKASTNSLSLKILVFAGIIFTLICFSNR